MKRPPAHNQHEGRFLPEAGRGALYFKKMVPADRSGVRLQVAILHDLLEYHRYQAAPGAYLIDKLGPQVEVSWMDFAGHGLSTGTRQHMDSFASLLSDLQSFLSEQAFTPGAGKDVRRLVVATGLGALVLLRLLQTKDLGDLRPHGMVLAGPLVRPLFRMPRVGARFLKQWGPQLGRLRFPMPPRSQWVRGQKLIETQSSDPLVGSSIPLGPMLEIMENAERVRRDSFFPDIPTLIQVGELDLITDVETSRIFHKGLGKTTASFKQYEGMRHDLYNDPGADRALEDVYNWTYEKVLLHPGPGRP